MFVPRLRARACNQLVPSRGSNSMGYMALIKAGPIITKQPKLISTMASGSAYREPIRPILNGQFDAPKGVNAIAPVGTTDGFSVALLGRLKTVARRARNASMRI